MIDPTEIEAIVRCCAGFNLRKADRAVTQLFDRLMASAGITATQFTLLTALALHPGAPIGQLAAGLVIDRTTLTRNLQLLVKQDLVRITPGRDQRQRRVALTAAGQAMLERTLPRWHEAQAKVLKALGGERWQRLLADLRDVIDAVRPLPNGPPA